jgi:hypothetical protein
MKLLLMGLLAFVVYPGVVRTQVKHTENTLKLAEGQTSEAATIADMAWLAGSWDGTGLDGQSSEIWSKPGGGMMVGAYRLVKDGKPIFFEAMFLLEQDGTLVLRLKHFHANLVGWEEKDKTVDFKFVKKDGKRVYFSGLTFENVGGKELNIYLALRQKDGTINEELFKMKRNN